MTDIGATFRALHQRGNPLVMINAWDRGSAVMMQNLGAKAIATTSAGHAFSLGRVDGGTISRDEALAHAQDLVSAVDIPVSGDFENGFGGSPETVAETIRMAAEVGLAGCSIEDTALPEFGAYAFDLSVERIRAAASAARALPGDFVMIARADGLIYETYDLDEAIRRVQAYEAAGADGVYIPAPPDFESLKRIVDSVSVPVNALASGGFANHSLAEFARIGVARISVGAALSRVAYGAAVDAAKEMVSGGFSGLSRAIEEEDMDALLQQNGD
ncbi:MAG: isocitrate lyase/phosphoenolpyruvate mutase family protein [Pseudomonadota bacterium]